MKFSDIDLNHTKSAYYLASELGFYFTKVEGKKCIRSYYNEGDLLDAIRALFRDLDVADEKNDVSEPLNEYISYAISEVLQKDKFVPKLKITEFCYPGCDQPKWILAEVFISNVFVGTVILQKIDFQEVVAEIASDLEMSIHILKIATSSALQK